MVEQGAGGEKRFNQKIASVVENLVWREKANIVTFSVRWSYGMQFPLTY